MFKIQQATLSDIGFFREHCIRHGAESGKNGDIIFSPYEEGWNDTEENLRIRIDDKWDRDPASIGWERCWFLKDNNNIYGSLKLIHQPPLKASIHRATLVIGLEKSCRRQGYGSRLINEALAWAREQTSLEYIDLYVFAHNQAGINLYRKFQFQEVSRVQDFFRVNNKKIDDIHMVLKL